MKSYAYCFINIAVQIRFNQLKSICVRIGNSLWINPNKGFNVYKKTTEVVWELCFALTFTCLYYILDSADAIKCYLCMSNLNTNCNDEFNSNGITIIDYCQSCTKIKGEYTDTGFKGKNIIDNKDLNKLYQ